MTFFQRFISMLTGIWRERSRSVTSGRGVIVDLPPARDISNAVHRHDGEDDGTDTPVYEDISQMLWAWGQFLAHDIVETPEGNREQCYVFTETIIDNLYTYPNLVMLLYIPCASASLTFYFEN